MQGVSNTLCLKQNGKAIFAKSNKFDFAALHIAEQKFFSLNDTILIFLGQVKIKNLQINIKFDRAMIAT